MVNFYDEAEEHLLKYAVIFAETEGKYVFCKHKQELLILILSQSVCILLQKRSFPTAKKHLECCIMQRFGNLKKNCIVKLRRYKSPISCRTNGRILKYSLY